MRAGLHLFGWALLALTTLSLVGEMAARGLYQARGFYLSAEELWAALAPESYAGIRAWFRSEARPFWIYGFGPILKLPAWLLFGLPGMLAIGYARRLDMTSHDFDVEGVFLYEELVRHARDEGYLGAAEDHPPEDNHMAILASARAAEADLAREPIVPAPRESEARKTAPEPAANEESPPPVNRPPS
jgi:hypothetical protein